MVMNNLIGSGKSVAEALSVIVSWIFVFLIGVFSGNDIYDRIEQRVEHRDQLVLSGVQKIDGGPPSSLLESANSQLGTCMLSLRSCTLQYSLSVGSVKRFLETSRVMSEKYPLYPLLDGSLEDLFEEVPGTPRQSTVEGGGQD